MKLNDTKNNMETKNKILAIGVLGIFLFLIVVNIQPVNAEGEFWACFQKSEVINYCDLRPEGGTYFKPDQTCDSDNGCTKCMSKFYEDKDGGCYVHGSWPKCNQLPPGCSTTGGGGEIILDVEAPVLTINNPVQDGIYGSRNVLLDFIVNEEADIYYTDLDTGRGRWTRVCSDCAEYSRERSFSEGLNNLSFRATDVVGNKDYFNISFVIDSQDPKIKGTSPTGGFVNTILRVELEEENPKSLEAHYGNIGTGFVVAPLDLFGDCVEDDGELLCEKDVDLTTYDGQDIEYWFVVTDIADNVDESTHYTLSVDDSDPVILNNPFYEVIGKYVYFSIEIDEINFDEAGYNYIDDKGKLKEKRLCSKLDDEGFCEKRISFKDGNHDLTIYVIDEAGNSIAVPINFFTDSKAPKIKKALPTRGFASGDFYVEFQEENPETLILHYGNDPVGMREEELDIENDCENIKGKSDKQECDVSVDLTDYNGDEIEYWFTLTDIVGSEGESRHYDLDVDTSSPVINNPLDFFEIDGRYVYFSLDITEENLDEVGYSYTDDRGRLKEKKLCSKLKEGFCEKRVSFKDGTYDLTISVLDEAGNSIGVPASFEIIK